MPLAVAGEGRAERSDSERQRLHWPLFETFAKLALATGSGHRRGEPADVDSGFWVFGGYDLPQAGVPKGAVHSHGVRGGSPARKILLFYAIFTMMCIHVPFHTLADH